MANQSRATTETEAQKAIVDALKELVQEIRELKVSFIGYTHFKTAQERARGSLSQSVSFEED